MTLIPATFLAGALLSLLIPAILLVALVVWYVMFIRRVPETLDSFVPRVPKAGDGPGSVSPTAAAGTPPGQPASPPD